MRLHIIVVLLALGAALVRAQDEFADDDNDVIDNVEEDVVETPTKKVVGPLDYDTPSAPQPHHFADAFANGDGARWVRSEAKKDGVEDTIAKYDGEWAVRMPTNVVLLNDYALMLTTKARHHAIAAKLDRPYTFAGAPFVMQYDVKFENGQECGGAYVKLLTQTRDLNLNQFTDKTPYSIMFGPDRCGLTSKVHLIVRYENPVNHTIAEHHAKQPSSLSDTYFTDKMTHLYTLVIRADGAYQVLVDNKEIMGGNLHSDVTPPIEPELQMNDPADVKPTDWDEREKIDDPEASKPDDWDEDAPLMIVDTAAVMPDAWLTDEPALIPDETASKPDDWDEEMDGVWEAPSVSNPACAEAPGCGAWTQPEIKNPSYKGKWKVPRIVNPSYQGKWAPRFIDNPNHFTPDAYKLSPIGAIGLELWTMSDNIVFDNFLITDDPLVAKQFAQSTYDVKVAHEAAMHRSANAGVAETFMNTLVDSANESPWLWAVYVLVVLVPVVLIVVFCCNTNKDTTAVNKKVDAVTEDDERITDEESDGEPMGEELIMDAEPQASTSRNADVRQRHQAKQQADLEEEEEAAPEEEVVKAKKSPARRSRARKE